MEFGKLGRLIYQPGHEESVKMKSLSCFNATTGERLMFDRMLNQWVSFNAEIVAPTYSIAPPPRNAFDEVNYFVATAGLIKHKFIWHSGGSVSKGIFEKLKSRKNTENYKV